MACNLCGEKMPNCDCTDAERRMYAEIEEAAEKTERLRLTDAERVAIGVAIQCVEAARAQRHPEEHGDRDLLWKTTCGLRGLLKRMQNST